MKNYCIAYDFSLKQFNTMRIDARAEMLIIPLNSCGVVEALDDFADQEIIILGNGSNTIFSKSRYSAPILLTSMLNGLEYSDGCVTSDSGVVLSKLSWFALENGVSGFEYLEDIPGSVGGALCMNAGTYDDNISKQVVSVTLYDFAKKEIVELSDSDLTSTWGKRDSYFLHNDCFIISCKLHGKNVNRDYGEILDNILSIKRNRYTKQPRNYPNAGSVFKRPYLNGEPRYIWKLFDEAGLRGFRVGDAQVSEKHPGFIVNRGNATGDDVISLLNHCKDVVLKEFGISIEEEWRIV